ncbi:MAG: site-2 protease family protein [Oscillospiraceae bacterium]
MPHFICNMPTKNTKQKRRTASAPTFRVKIGSGFLLLIAVVYFFDDSGFLLALLPAILAHEIGHLIAMRTLGARPTLLCASLSGLSLDYSGNLSSKQEMLTALSGPIFGILFSIVCAWLGKFLSSEYLLLCAGLGFVINVFNLLPALPLDGGRVLSFILSAAFGKKLALSVSNVLGYLISALLLCLGLYCVAKGYGAALMLAGMWLFILQRTPPCKYGKSVIQ